MNQHLPVLTLTCEELVAAPEELQVFSVPQQNQVHLPEVCDGFSVPLLNGVSSGHVVQPLPHHCPGVVQYVVLSVSSQQAGLGAEPRSWARCRRRTIVTCKWVLFEPSISVVLF